MSEQQDPVQAMVDAMLASEEPKTEAAATEADVPEASSEQVEPEKTEVDTEVEGEKEERLVPFSDLNKEIAGKAKLRAERRELREEVARLRAELDSLKGGKLPDVDDFETAEEYEEALKKHEQASQPVSPTFMEAKATLFDQREDWDNAPSDWEEVVTDNKLPFTQAFIVEVSDLDNGAEVLYALAKNPEALTKIMGKRTDAMRVRELEKFAESLSTPAANSMAAPNLKQKPNVSAIDPVGGGSKGKASLESLSVADHLNAVRSRGFYY